MQGVVPRKDDAASRPTTLDLERATVLPGQSDTLRVSGGTGYQVAPTVRSFRIVGQRTAEFTGGRCQIGTHEGNDVVVADPTVSRFHCEVRIEDKRPMIYDLGSTNGTFVDGTRVKVGYLKHGSVLTLGAGTTLRFELDDKATLLPVSAASDFGELIGAAASMRATFAVLEKAARTDATVVLEGETGTGKSKAALAVHQRSARASKPFLVVDCSALPPTLLEAELFGHEKGAFTGAAGARQGVFEEADGGTVLLDEIGDLPLELQPKLLRVLEEGQVRRLGQNQWTAVDVRIIAATHRDLREAVNTGRFRSDLYFRLAVVRVTLPPLRERLDDLPDLARALLTRLGATPKSHPALFSAAFLSGLSAHAWPGNVRELRNYLERSLVFEGPAPMGEAASGATPASWRGLPFPVARRRALDAFEVAYVQQLLERYGKKMSQAAIEAEVDRAYLHRLVRRHGLGKREPEPKK